MYGQKISSILYLLGLFSLCLAKLDKIENKGNESVSSMHCLEKYFAANTLRDSIIIKPQQIADVDSFESFISQKRWTSKIYRSVNDAMGQSMSPHSIIWFISNENDLKLDSELFLNFPRELEMNIIWLGSVTESEAQRVFQKYSLERQRHKIRIFAENGNNTWMIYSGKPTKLYRKTKKIRCSFFERGISVEKFGYDSLRVLLVDSFPFAFTDEKVSQTITGIDVMILNSLARASQLQVNFEKTNSLGKLSTNQLQ